MNGKSRLRTPAALAALVFLMLAACTAAPTGGAELDLTGMPAGTAVEVAVSGPNGYSEVVDLPATLTGLPAGTYAAVPADVELANDGYIGTERFAAEPVEFEVVADQSTAVSLDFVYAGARVEDATDDTTSYPGSTLDYDIVSIVTSFDADDLILELNFEPTESDLSELIVLLDLDVDQDPTTGTNDNFVNGFCVPVPNSLGVEYQIDYEDSDGTFLVDTVADSQTDLAAPVIDGSRVTFTVPRASIGGVGRLNVGLVVGNTEGPTDCTQGEAVL